MSSVPRVWYVYDTRTQMVVPEAIFYDERRAWRWAEDAFTPIGQHELPGFIIVTPYKMHGKY